MPTAKGPPDNAGGAPHPQPTMTRAKDARLVRLSEPGRIPEDPPSVTLEDPPSSPYLPVPPDSRSPSTFVIAEATAVRVLVRQYGWAWLEAGTLRRPQR
jgi:hypothetical protein